MLRRLLSWLLYRVATWLTKAAVRIHPDGAAAISIAILGDEPVLGTWHRGHIGCATAAAIIARAEADRFDQHVATMEEIDFLTRTTDKDPT